MASLECAKNGVFCFKLIFQRNKGSYMTCSDCTFVQPLLDSPFVLYFCCFVSFRSFFNLRHLFRYARAYVRTGSYAPDTYLTIILRNRAEYHLILSRRGRRPSWLNQGIFRKIEQDNCFIIQQIPIDYHFQNEKNYGSMITLKLATHKA